MFGKIYHRIICLITIFLVCYQSFLIVYGSSFFTTEVYYGVSSDCIYHLKSPFRADEFVRSLGIILLLFFIYSPLVEYIKSLQHKFSTRSLFYLPLMNYNRTWLRVLLFPLSLFYFVYVYFILPIYTYVTYESFTPIDDLLWAETHAGVGYCAQYYMERGIYVVLLVVVLILLSPYGIGAIYHYRNKESRHEIKQ